MILMLLYNVSQVLLCGYMMLEALRVAVTHYKLPVCNEHHNTPETSMLKDVLWLFYVSKVLDFADTFFIVVRGKWEQFSFLHIYHHFSSEAPRERGRDCESERASGEAAGRASEHASERTCGRVRAAACGRGALSRARTFPVVPVQRPRARAPAVPPRLRFAFSRTTHARCPPASTAAVFLTYWLVANAAPDGDVYYTVVANSFVHFVSE